MSHQLDFITRGNIVNAIERINEEEIPKKNQWSEYYISYKNKKYQFKYVVEVASSFTNRKIKTIDFTTNDSSRNYIASLGFHICFIDQNIQDYIPKYWVGASYYGDWGSQINKFDDFIKNKYWGTDHDLNIGKGLKIFNKLKSVSVNDRICIRFLNRKGSTVHIAAIGTVYEVKDIKNGILGVKWDFNPPEYKGVKPSGIGAGNWWGTFIQLTRPNDIQTIFGFNYREKRIARLAWNDNGWIMPSGPDGKSQHEDSHEAKFGYGHEEWLFDTSKIIDGYHYAFLEPIRKQQNAYLGNIYDVWLYTIDGLSKRRYWIGEIKGVEVIDNDEAERIKKIYDDNGWLNEMKNQIKDSGANNKGFSGWDGIDLFNVRFKSDNIELNEETYVQLSDNHPVVGLSRYVFGNYNTDFNTLEVGEENEGSFEFIPDESEDFDDETNKVKTKKSFRKPKAVEIKYLHDAISKSMFKYLKTQCKYEVRREHKAGHGATKIDLVAKDGKNLIFYEIKTYHSLRCSIREAIGQLLEYAHWPDNSKADKLVIVTQPHKKEAIAIKYVQHLRKTLRIPLYYQSYDLDKKELSEEF